MEKRFIKGVVIPHKLRNCNICGKDNLCDGCDKLGNQNEEFSANLNEFKKISKEFGHMLPCYKRI